MAILLTQRDTSDRTRAASPLYAAADATILAGMGVPNFHQSILAVPLRSGGRVTGAIVLSMSGSDRLAPEDVNLIEPGDHCNLLGRPF